MKEEKITTNEKLNKDFKFLKNFLETVELVMVLLPLIVIFLGLIVNMTKVNESQYTEVIDSGYIVEPAKPQDIFVNIAEKIIKYNINFGNEMLNRTIAILIIVRNNFRLYICYINCR